MDKRTKQTITLGSGKLYITEFLGNIPINSTIETDENLAGYIQGGAELGYKPEFYTAEDDLGKVKKTIITKEEVKIKSGIMTWNADTLAKLTSTASSVATTPATSSASGKKVVKIGGIGRFTNTQYVIRFVYSDAKDGDVRITIVGSNEAGFEMAFAKDAETVINAEFKAVPNDSDGTLVIFEEILPQLAS